MAITLPMKDPAVLCLSLDFQVAGFNVRSFGGDCKDVKGSA